MRATTMPHSGVMEMKSMKLMKYLVPLLCVLVSLQAAHANDIADAGRAEIRELGRINGHALACGQHDSAARIKALMIAHAPKTRDYGSTFEDATNQAFLEQSKEAGGCQAGAVLTLQAQDVSQRLRALFPAQPEQK